MVKGIKGRGVKFAVTAGAVLALLTSPLGAMPAQAAGIADVTVSISPLRCDTDFYQVFDGTVTVSPNAVQTIALVVKVSDVTSYMSDDYSPGQTLTGEFGFDPNLAPGTPYTITATVDGQALGTPVTGTAPDCYPVGLVAKINGPTCLADGSAGVGYTVENGASVPITTVLNGGGRWPTAVTTPAGGNSVVGPYSYPGKVPGATTVFILTEDSGFYFDEAEITWPDCGTPPPPVDSDGDKVTDDKDTCANTPAGAVVDANGCAATQRDTDNDGVTDDKDTCANTPAGAVVDANGCAATQRDTDNDGVTDDKDTCANTPAGAVVDANGCVVVVTPPPDTRPIPTVTVKAKSHKSKLFVDINPNRPKKGYWKFQVQKLATNGTSWIPGKTYRTKGSKETRTINLKKGTYRVVVIPDQFGFRGATSASVYLKK